MKKKEINKENYRIGNHTLRMNRIKIKTKNGHVDGKWKRRLDWEIFSIFNVII